MKVISVKFKENGRAYYFDPAEMEISRGDYVIVETARGTECGEVVRGVHEVSENGFNKELKPVVRMADGVECAPDAPEPRGPSAAPLRCAPSGSPSTAWP